MDARFNADFLVCDPGYAGIMDTVVLPWLSEKEHVSEVPGCRGNPLFCVSYNADNPVGTVVLVHGFTENAFKYAELVWSLLHLRFSVVAYDQRGHGRSWRADGISDCSVTHVDRFSDYVEDLRLVCDAYRHQMPGPFLLFAHSMGGAVASLFLEQYPGVFSAAVLSSPMVAPYIGGIPVTAACLLASAAGILGRRKKHPFFMKPWSGPENFETSCATDPARFAWYDLIRAERPEFRNSIPSWQWSLESIRVTQKILASGAPERISCPVLIFTAGIDSSVLPEPQAALASRIPLGKQVLVSRAKHEIFRSVNEVLFPWWHEVVAFFTEASCPVHTVKE